MQSRSTAFLQRSNFKKNVQEIWTRKKKGQLCLIIISLLAVSKMDHNKECNSQYAKGFMLGGDPWSPAPYSQLLSLLEFCSRDSVAQPGTNIYISSSKSAIRNHGKRLVAFREGGKIHYCEEETAYFRHIWQRF